MYGELLTFDDPETRLPAIDRLEGFHPGGSCLYRRVLVLVRVNGGVIHAWLYVVDVTGNRGLTPLPSGKWRS
ncbi:MAG: gamma-glutamylcyclotransferase [Nitrospira sp.]|nr:gamma-glutamylcyclotransferase [Nitrospira sp.]